MRCSIFHTRSGSSSNVISWRSAIAPPKPSVAAVSDSRLPTSKHVANRAPLSDTPVHESARAGAASATHDRGEREPAAATRQRGRGGAHRLNRSPASTTNAHWSGMPGMSLRFSPPAASLSDERLVVDREDDRLVLHARAHALHEHRSGTYGVK